MAGTDLTEARKRAFRSWVQSYFDVELPPDRPCYACGLVGFRRCAFDSCARKAVTR